MQTHGKLAETPGAWWLAGGRAAPCLLACGHAGVLDMESRPSGTPECRQFFWVVFLPQPLHASAGRATSRPERAEQSGGEQAEMLRQNVRVHDQVRPEEGGPTLVLRTALMYSDLSLFVWTQLAGRRSNRRVQLRGCPLLRDREAPCRQSSEVETQRRRVVAGTDWVDDKTGRE